MEYGVGAQSDGLIREDGALKNRAVAEGRRAADLPEHILGLRSVEQEDLYGVSDVQS